MKTHAQKNVNAIHLLPIKQFLLIGSDPNREQAAFSLPALTSPRWPHEVRGVIDNELEIIQQQDVDACGGGDPRSIWRERDA